MPPRPQLEENGGGGHQVKHYGSIGQHDVEKIPLMMTDSIEDGDDIEKKEEPKRVVKIVAVTVLVIAIVSMIAYIVIPHVLNSVGGEDHPYTHHHSATTHHNFDDTSANPFKLDPVNDLGMLSIDRSQTDASPSSIWKNRTGPIPTNSWYLVSN
jgi:hypothetical protein